MSKKPEALLLQRVCNYLKTEHPYVPYLVDYGADVKLSIGESKRRKELQGRWSRGHPDLTIYGPKGKAIFIELKATKTVVKSEHTQRQKVYHRILRDLGYKCDFACGYDQAIAMIDEYLKKDKK